jgi:hypothetical protein
MSKTQGQKTASVAVFITRDQRQQLYDLGHSKSDVDQMTPAEAHRILGIGTTPTVNDAQAAADAQPVTKKRSPKTARVAAHIEELNAQPLPPLESTGKASKPSLSYSLAQLEALDIPPRRFVLNQFGRGELGMCNSVTGKGKSTLLRNLAFRAALGQSFPPLTVPDSADPLRVMIADFETPLATLKEDIELMARNLTDSQRQEAMTRIFTICDAELGDEPFDPSRPEHFKLLTMEAKAKAVDLLVIDTMTAAFSIRDENSNAEVMRWLKPLRQMAKELDAGVLVLHHIGKSNTEEGRIAEKAYRARGASAFGSFPSVVLNLFDDGQRENRIVLNCAKVKGRRYDDVVLELNQETRWFTLTQNVPVLSRTTTDLILELLQDGKVWKRAEIEEALTGKCNLAGIKRALSKAVSAGQLSVPRRGFFQLKSLAQGDFEGKSKTAANSMK